MLQEDFPQVLVAVIVPAPTLQHNLLVFVPGSDEVRVKVTEDAPGRPIHDGYDGALHGGDPGFDGAVGEDEFGMGVGGEEFFDHAGGREVHDGLVTKSTSKNDFPRF